MLTTKACLDHIEVINPSVYEIRRQLEVFYGYNTGKPILTFTHSYIKLA